MGGFNERPNSCEDFINNPVSSVRIVFCNVCADFVKIVEILRPVFDAYEASRKPRTSQVQAGSSANTWMRNATNPEWLYGYDPRTAPLAAAVAA